ncbi:MAG: FxDxF family PEP-CTERM protein [Azonexus sp.]|nr:FxDxF family PEP-CTERM protein [Azonexus sp.]
MKKFITGMALAIAAVSAFAAPAPSASLTTSGATFAEYTGSTVGSNDININNTLFWMYEGTNLGHNSYLLMFDPLSNGSMAGSVTFSGNIAYVASTTIALVGTDFLFSKPGVTYDWKTNSGLESNDSLSISGNTLTLSWRGASPGDHIRVLTAVPEPESYAMFLAGLGIIGAMIRRKNI